MRIQIYIDLLRVQLSYLFCNKIKFFAKVFIIIIVMLFFWCSDANKMGHFFSNLLQTMQSQL